MNYYRKNVDNNANDLKLNMRMAAFTLKLSENINKINDLLKTDKDIKKDITDNSNSIKNMKNEIDNYYDKNEIDLKFNDLYNKTYIDHKLDDIYDKTEINDKNSKLNRNIALFNTNLTNHIDKYSNEKQIIDKDIKENEIFGATDIEKFQTILNSAREILQDFFRFCVIDEKGILLRGDLSTNLDDNKSFTSRPSDLQKSCLSISLVYF